jgi:hypothetical protein
MTVYLTKVWGFTEPVGPLQFSTDGWRDRARNALRPGDLVVLVGTKGPPTEDAERGRLLGMMEPTTEPVLSLDFDLPTRPEHFDEGAHYKWPYGLLNRNAWRLLDRPLLEEVSDRSFNMDSALGLVDLSASEAARILALRRIEAPLLAPTVRARARLEGLDAVRRRSAPPPTTTRRGVMHMRGAPAFTYALKLKGASSIAFKIGWAFDYKLRTRQFNIASMPQLGGISYVPVFNQLWDTARQAFVMEQDLLRHFSTRRHPHNSEVLVGVAEEELQRAWIDFMRR